MAAARDDNFGVRMTAMYLRKLSPFVIVIATALAALAAVETLKVPIRE
jgi:hypothetical protein